MFDHTTGKPTIKVASTSEQRGYVRGLLRKLGLPTDYTTLAHDKYFKGYTVYRHGKRVDDLLTELSRASIGSVIDALKYDAEKIK